MPRLNSLGIFVRKISRCAKRSRCLARLVVDLRAAKMLNLLSVRNRVASASTAAKVLDEDSSIH